MFKLTENDLAGKTDAQLVALFNQASAHIAPRDPHRHAAQSLQAMIRVVMAARRPSP